MCVFMYYSSCRIFVRQKTLKYMMIKIERVDHKAIIRPSPKSDKTSCFLILTERKMVVRRTTNF